MKKVYIYIVFWSLIQLSCTVNSPQLYVENGKNASIYPDYRDIVIPYNISPLNFRIMEEADDYLTAIFAGDSKRLIYRGKDVKIDIADWRQLLNKNKGEKLLVEIYIKKEGSWFKCSSIENYIAPHPIDEYISYRLIEPSYVTYRNLSIKQRNLTNFTEKDIYNNQALHDEYSLQCINCHSYKNYKTDNMQFHVRGKHGGTIVVSGGKPRKVNIKTGNLISGGVYPAWHPTENLIAYSVNHTGQLFYAKNIQKVEVRDFSSDLVLYDIDKNIVYPITNDSSAMETFPAWSPDGKRLFFASAKPDDVALNLRYDILSMTFDKDTKTFGEPDTLINASSIGKSATLPRISPDGKYLLYTLGDYGTFHIWHKSSDLHIVDLETGEEKKMENLNSPDVESYHSWSSNGRWIIFSSRRDDGSYTRPYISYFGEDGKDHKAFIVPQKSPDHYQNLMKSFNIPEFMIEPVAVSVREFANVIQADSIQAQLGE